MVRTVVLLCGPPGAGKTTTAKASGLDVYDRDEYLSEREFTAAITALQFNPDARAVVIRWGPSSTDRARTAQQIGATHARLLVEDRMVLAERITKRGRADATRTLAALNRWFGQHDRDDGVQAFTSWAEVLGSTPASRRW